MHLGRFRSRTRNRGGFEVVNVSSCFRRLCTILGAFESRVVPHTVKYVELPMLFQQECSCQESPLGPLQPVPASGKLLKRYEFLPHVPVAQLDRASASGAEGYRFESCRGYFRKWGLAPITTIGACSHFRSAVSINACGVCIYVSQLPATFELRANARLLPVLPLSAKFVANPGKSMQNPASGMAPQQTPRLCGS
jgi:hypothetical protein